MSSRRNFIEKLSVTAIGLPLLYSPAQLFANDTQPYDGPILNIVFRQRTVITMKISMP